MCITTMSWSSRKVRGATNDQGNYVEVTLRGTLLHNNLDYDGKNILQVAHGEAEPASS